MEITVTDLPDSRVRVEAEVPGPAVDKQMQRAARGLAREMRMPGFRKGKAPPSLVIQRIGRGAVLEQAVRDALPEWYEQALIKSNINPIGSPDIEVTSTPEDDGDALGFKFEIGVRPPAKLGEYKGLEVGRAGDEVPDDIVDREVETIREQASRLEPVERAAAMGDIAIIDFVGKIDDEPFEGGDASDYNLELGSDSLIEGFEEQLVGASAGSEVTVNVAFPGDYRAEHLAGRDAAFDVTVKEVREKILPDLDDDLASEATEFDTLDDMRADIREKLAEAAEQRIEEEFRVAAVDAAVENAEIEIPQEIIDAQAAERWERVERQLAQRGMDAATFLQMQGRTREDMIEEARPDAARELRRESVLKAIAEAEELDATEEEMLEALRHTAEHHERTTPEKLLERVRREDREQLVINDIVGRKAVDLVAEAAKPVPLSEEETRAKLWATEGPQDHDHAAHDHDHERSDGPAETEAQPQAEEAGGDPQELTLPGDPEPQPAEPSKLWTPGSAD